MRCTATQKIGPPSRLNEPQTAKKYSSQTGHLYPRWVCSRWYPMLIPRPVAIQYRNTAVQNLGQLNINKAAMAPTWKRPTAMVVVQFRPSRRGRLKTSAPASDPDLSTPLQPNRDRHREL